MEQQQSEMVQIREQQEFELAQKRERQERQITQMRNLHDWQERDMAESKQQQERELMYWKLQQEREIEEAKEQQRQQERALWEKQRQLEQEEDLLSKGFVPLGQLKRSVNEVMRSDATRAKSVLTRDEMGIWRRESPVFDSPVKKNKAELCRDDRLLDADGLLREDDEQSNRLTDAQGMQQQMRESNRLLPKGQNERQDKRLATSCVCGDMGPSPDRLKDVKPTQIDCWTWSAPSI